MYSSLKLSGRARRRMTAVACTTAIAITVSCSGGSSDDSEQTPTPPTQPVIPALPSPEVAAAELELTLFHGHLIVKSRRSPRCRNITYPSRRTHRNFASR